MKKTVPQGGTALKDCNISESSSSDSEESSSQSDTEFSISEFDHSQFKFKISARRRSSTSSSKLSDEEETVVAEGTGGSARTTYFKYERRKRLVDDAEASSLSGQMEVSSMEKYQKININNSTSINQSNYKSSLPEPQDKADLHPVKNGQKSSEKRHGDESNNSKMLNTQENSLTKIREKTKCVVLEKTNSVENNILPSSSFNKEKTIISSKQKNP